MLEQCFKELEMKYGEDFCWFKVSAQNNHLESEAYHEIPPSHPLSGIKLTPLAKSEVNDDVLFCTEQGPLIVIHLTYSKNNPSGFPKYKILESYQELKEYLEQ